MLSNILMKDCRVDPTEHTAAASRRMSTVELSLPISFAHALQQGCKGPLGPQCSLLRALLSTLQIGAQP